MYYRIRQNLFTKDDEEYLVGTRDLNINELVRFVIDGKLLEKRISNKQIVKLQLKENNLSKVAVYKLDSIFGPLEKLKFTNINITDESVKRFNKLIKEK